MAWSQRGCRAGPVEGPAPRATTKRPPPTTESDVCGHFLGAGLFTHSSHLILPTPHLMGEGGARKWQQGRDFNLGPRTSHLGLAAARTGSEQRPETGRPSSGDSAGWGGRGQETSYGNWA